MTATAAPVVSSASKVLTIGAERFSDGQTFSRDAAHPACHMSSKFRITREFGEGFRSNFLASTQAAATDAATIAATVDSPASARPPGDLHPTGAEKRSGCTGRPGRDARPDPEDGRTSVGRPDGSANSRSCGSSLSTTSPTS